jgi:hypothetical protein
MEKGRNGSGQGSRPKGARAAVESGAGGEGIPPVSLSIDEEAETGHWGSSGLDEREAECQIRLTPGPHQPRAALRPVVCRTVHKRQDDHNARIRPNQASGCINAVGERTGAPEPRRPKRTSGIGADFPPVNGTKEKSRLLALLLSAAGEVARGIQICMKMRCAAAWMAPPVSPAPIRPSASFRPSRCLIHADFRGGKGRTIGPDPEGMNGHQDCARVPGRVVSLMFRSAPTPGRCPCSDAARSGTCHSSTLLPQSPIQGLGRRCSELNEAG